MVGLSGLANPHPETPGPTKRHLINMSSGVVPGPAVNNKDTPNIQEIPRV